MNGYSHGSLLSGACFPYRALENLAHHAFYPHDFGNMCIFIGIGNYRVYAVSLWRQGKDNLYPRGKSPSRRSCLCPEYHFHWS